MQDFLIRIYKFLLPRFRGMGVRKIPLVGAILESVENMIMNRKHPESVRFDGHTIFLDPHDNQGLALWTDQEMSKGEREVAANSAKEGTVVIDVGANMGFFTLIFARKVGANGTVYAFEPEGENAKLLKKNIDANNYKNVIIKQKAVGERSGTLKLFLSDYNVGDHRVYDPAVKIPDMPKGNEYDKLAKWDRRPSVDVDVVTLDEELKEEQRSISLVKIDVQGAEGAVLRGMERIMRQNKDLVVVLEFWPPGLAMYGIDGKECLNLLTKQGFSLYEVSEQRGLIDKKCTPQEILDRYPIEGNKTAYLMAKR